MPLTKLQFKPGVVKDTTAYSNEGGWVDSDLVRFRFGYPEKIGGWQSRTNQPTPFLGTPRALHVWQNINGTQFVGVGTNLRYYIESGGVFNNITPSRRGHHFELLSSLDSAVGSGILGSVTVSIT